MRKPSSTKRFLGSLGYTFPDVTRLVESDKRLPTAHYRRRFPVLRPPLPGGDLREAARFGVPVHRVSQGSGAFMHTDDELDRFATLGAAAGVEISIFARPNSG